MGYSFGRGGGARVPAACVLGGESMFVAAVGTLNCRTVHCAATSYLCELLMESMSMTWTHRNVIVGAITTADVLTHAGLIWREFGPRCFLRCARALFRTRPTTFLDVAMVYGGSPMRRSRSLNLGSERRGLKPSSLLRVMSQYARR